MSEVPALYWMIVIGVLAASIVALIFYLAMSAKELAKTMATVNDTMVEAQKVVLSAQAIVSEAETKITSLLGTIDQVNTLIQSPLAILSDLLGKLLKKVK